MGIFNNIKAKGNMNISGVNINNGMSILEQTKTYIKEITKNKSGEYIYELKIKSYGYVIKVIGGLKEIEEYFASDEEMADWLNKKGWNIKTR